MKKLFLLPVLVLTLALQPAAFAEEAAPADAQIASADEKVEAEDVVEDWMVPIPGSEIEDGSYPIEVASSSSMFVIDSCILTVKDGEMSALMVMGGTGYLKLFMGTPEEAVAASEEEYIPVVEAQNGAHTFTVHVEALDKGIDCAAFSKRKEKWYDRVLVFKSTSIPRSAIKNAANVTAETLGLADGEYTAEVTLAGGSGKAKVESPALISIEDQKICATIVWSSKNYDYMKINDEKYLPINEEGNSTFKIPVDSFDYNMPVIADTVAMSQPHEIDYTLYFDSATLAPVEE